MFWAAGYIAISCVICIFVFLSILWIMTTINSTGKIADVIGNSSIILCIVSFIACIVFLCIYDSDKAKVERYLHQVEIRETLVNVCPIENKSARCEYEWLNYRNDSIRTYRVYSDVIERMEK